MPNSGDNNAYSGNANGGTGMGGNSNTGYTQDTLNAYAQAPGYTGAGGQGWFDPTTGQVVDHWVSGGLQLNRPGIDSRLQGNLENPYSGYLFGKPGAAEADESRLQGLAAAARNAPAAQINNAQYNTDRGLEMGSRGNQDYGLGQYRTAINQYQNMINGNGPSVAEQQMRRGIAMSNAQQQSIMAGARGGGAGLAAAQAAGANAAANASGNVIGQMGTVRATEQLGAMQGQLGAIQGYGGLATSQRMADLQREGLSADQAYKQAQLEETQHQINATTGLGYEQMRQGEASTQMQGQEYNESENQNAYMGGQGLSVQREQNQTDQNNKYVDAGITAGSVALKLASDVRNKKDIGDGRPAVQQQMGAMSPQAYQYRDPSIAGAGPGQRVGVMAQDMERGPYGHQLVKNTPEGKKIDGPGGLSLALASGADHEQRLRQLEQRAASLPVGAPGSKQAMARQAAYDAYRAARPGGLAAAAYEQRQQNAAPFNNFVPEGAIQLPAQQPSGLAAAARLQASGYR